MPLSTIKLTASWARRTGGRKEPAASPPLHPSVCWCCRGRPTKPGPCQCRQRPAGPATQLLSLMAANATKRRRAQRHVLAARSAVGVGPGARIWMIQSTRDASAPKQHLDASNEGVACPSSLPCKCCDKLWQAARRAHLLPRAAPIGYGGRSYIGYGAPTPSAVMSAPAERAQGLSGFVSTSVPNRVPERRTPLRRTHSQKASDIAQLTQDRGVPYLTSTLPSSRHALCLRFRRQ